eukprot:g2944.t1
MLWRSGLWKRVLAAALIAAIPASAAPGQIDLAEDFKLSWTISPPHIDFTLSWNASGGYDWAAIGLHSQPGVGMPNAEIFMCNPKAKSAPSGDGRSQAFCQVRNSAAGYQLPALDKAQYLTMLTSSRGSDGAAKASFRRSLAAVPGSPLSVTIANHTMGLIYARGRWNGDPMPSGEPEKHTDAGRVQVNFYEPSPAPSPSPPSPSPSKVAGVWPSVFEANMTIARGQAIENGQLTVTCFAQLFYDFPRRRQLWQYSSLDPSTPGGGGRKLLGGELWINETLYEISPGDEECLTTNLGFDIVQPDWLQKTHYQTTNFLLRQPKPGQHWSNYTSSDLFTLPNTIGMTNSWLVEDSKIAEPVRLEGPDDDKHVSWRSILEYSIFKPIDGKLPDELFDVPAVCKNSSAAESSGLDPKYRGSGFFIGVQRALLEQGRQRP